MSLGLCLEEIRKLLLNQDKDLMLDLGIDLISEIKGFFGGDYPRSGWFLTFEDNQVYASYRCHHFSLRPYLKKIHKA